ncbi:MAG: diphthine synthase [Euryarchaeota archaeon]|nr:diphthine synthase [Euryarchaeota archaeon]
MTADMTATGLWLIGLGPGNLDQMTILALKVAKGCSKLYLEGYTAMLPEEEEARLEELVGPWEKIMRESIEFPKKILDEAKSNSIGILIVGDPMQATTHIDLESHCQEHDIDFYVIPGLSATSLAVSLSGMQSYRFGRQITLPYSYGDYLPLSPLEIYIRNYNFGLHTLMLLDLDPTGMGMEQPKPMQPHEVFSLIEKMVQKFKDEREGIPLLEIPVCDWHAILLSDLGSNKQQIFAGTLGDLSKIESGKIHSFILTAKFTGMEEEAFNRRRYLA